jgi:hypothetical protein
MIFDLAAIFAVLYPNYLQIKDSDMKNQFLIDYMQHIAQNSLFDGLITERS